MNEVNLETARRVLEFVDAGLVRGVGVQEPGKMCVEAAVCAALGLPHGDNPPCVAPSVRSYKIRLNDARWSSEAARAKGLRRVAVAQLGSAGVIDERKFARIVAEQTIRQIVPLALRRAAEPHKSPEHKAALLAAAERCAQDGTRDAAMAATAAYADAAAYAAAYAAADAAAAAYAAAAAAADAYAAAAADAYAAADYILTLSADICLAALRECGSPGVALLDEIEATR